MIKKLSALLFLCNTLFALAQNSKSNEYPVFVNCENLKSNELEYCFYSQLQNLIFNNFTVPEVLMKKGYKGKVEVLFGVDTTGNFKVLYVDSIHPEIISECNRVFGLLPMVKPVFQDFKPLYAKYSIAFEIPLNKASQVVASSINLTNLKNQKYLALPELDSIRYKKFDFPIFQSQLNIPFSHSYYAQFDDEINQMGANNHTASKPYTYSEVAKYHDFNGEYNKVVMNKSGWLGRKLFNENLVQLRGEDYWLTLNPIFDLQLGKSNPSQVDYTFQNTRGIQIQGGVLKELVFTTTIYESQGRFADYYNRFAESIKPSGGNPAIIPGIGIGKSFKTDGYDFPSADAHVIYTPSKYINLALGYGRNFIGDGYRSILLGDGASPYPFFKINTAFWKIKYTNIYMWLKDVRPEVTADKTYSTKYIANHYLSWNVTNRFNLGLFESVIWTDTNGRGFDANFYNPIIFYRTVEFTSSSRSGNAFLGLTSKYKLNNKINIYGQFVLDEFSLDDIKEQKQSWKNKYAYQLGIKYFNAFGVKNLMLQSELNSVRPYVYSHSESITNYGHNNQSMGHPWGGNLRELIGIVRYHYGRFYVDSKFIYGFKGFDFDTAANNFNYGSNIYKDYDDNRPFDTGVKTGQGNKTKILIADIQGGFLINPTTNFKLFGSLICRNFDPTQNTTTIFKENTVWFTLGVRSDIFNWYFDY